MSYVFNICSYVLDKHSGWEPMHFSKMDHLLYGHSFIHVYGHHEDVFHLQLISSSNLVFSTWSCSIQWRFFRSTIWQCLQLHASMMFFMIILLFLSSETLFPSLFGVGFSLFLLFKEIWLYLNTSSGLVVKTQIYFQ